MKKLLLIVCLFASRQAMSQQIEYSRKILDTLTSKTMWGRGYTKEGLSRAAVFITNELRSYGLKPMDGKDFKQSFSFPVNTFPGAIMVKINETLLIPGKDFIVEPQSIGSKGRGKFDRIDSATFVNLEHKISVVLKDKLTWSVAQEKGDYTGILVDKKSLSGTPMDIEVNIENNFVPDFKTANICAMVKGTREPDSLLLITAHYDHLGGMGAETYFPGANDNASGISMLLSLAKYYAENPAPYSIGFICFSGEEAGLVGSKYFTEHPLVPLYKIRFLINMDMVGTGETGITVVNATLHPKEFVLLNNINDAEHLLVKINKRGKAANSDHYFFTEKGVPAFFIYTQGGISAYHDVNDIAATLPLSEYNDLFRIFVAFNKQLMSVR